MKIAVVEFLKQLTEMYKFPVNSLAFELRLSAYVMYTKEITGIHPILKADRRSGRIEVEDLVFSPQCRFKSMLEEMNVRYRRLPFYYNADTVKRITSEFFTNEVEKNSGLKVEPIFVFEGKGVVSVEDVLVEVGDYE